MYGKEYDSRNDNLNKKEEELRIGIGIGIWTGIEVGFDKEKQGEVERV